MGKKSNPIVIRSDTRIGNNHAEADDEFLFQCFVDHPALSEISSTNSSKLFLCGRTGAGKTAMIRMIQKNNANCTALNLEDMAMSYIANSDIMRFLSAIDVDLDLFFQALWKHVLCIEYIRLRFNVRNEVDSKSTIRRFAEFVTQDARKRKALEYLTTWESKFWVTMDENIREITSKLEEKIGAELGVEIQKFRSNAGYARTLSSEKKANYSQRAKKIVNAEQLGELSKVLDLLASYEDSSKYPSNHFLLIDKLDEKWVDESIRFKLIRALIECLRSFRKIKNLKTVVSIRSDVLERVIQESDDVGFQREKYDDYFQRIVWNREQLKEVVDKRINYLFRRKYNSSHIHFSDVFPNAVQQKDPLDYMLDRTLMRPRDIIVFVNECLEKAEEKNEVFRKDILNAEGEYSQIRLQALYEEWQSALPSLKVVLPFFARFGERSTIDEISVKETIEDLILEIAGSGFPETDPIAREANAYIKAQEGGKIVLVAKLAVSELYRIGAIGIKTQAHERYIYSYKDAPVVRIEALNGRTKIHVHPMLHHAFDLPPAGPSFITRVCGFGFDSLRFRFGQARRARSRRFAQALGALAAASGFRVTSAA